MAAPTNGMLEPPCGQPAAHGVKWCICSIYFLSSVTHYHYCFTFFHRHFYHLSLSHSLILIFLHRNEEEKRQHAVERGGATVMEAGKKIVAYSFPYFNYVTHCVLSLP